jgi:hypothetical protein
MRSGVFVSAGTTSDLRLTTLAYLSYRNCSIEDMYLVLQCQVP